MGNDGTKRVPSPASADMGFAVSSASDLAQQIEPTMASQVLPITGLDSMMMMITNGTNSNQIYHHMVLTSSQQLRLRGHLSWCSKAKADSGYDEKDGTSMATPIASGIDCTVREAAPSLDAFEVMDVIRNSSEIRDKPANTVSDRWHENGFQPYRCILCYRFCS